PGAPTPLYGLNAVTFADWAKAGTAPRPKPASARLRTVSESEGITDCLSKGLAATGQPRPTEHFSVTGYPIEGQSLNKPRQTRAATFGEARIRGGAVLK